MKRLIFLTWLIPIFIFGQSMKADYEIADSLIAGSDTLHTWNTSYGYVGYDIGEWWICAKDTGTASGSIKDSAGVWAGSIRNNIRTGSAVDTFWTRVWFKDSVGNNTNVIQASGVQSRWLPLISMPRLLKIELINAQFVSGRRWDYFIEGKRRIR